MNKLRNNCEEREVLVKRLIKNLKNVPKQLKGVANKKEEMEGTLEKAKYGSMHPQTDNLLQELVSIEEKSEMLRKKNPVNSMDMAQIASQVWKEVKSQQAETRLHS